ncbi:MAG TPA: gliding motility-associated C-terminal domain-containing protein [Cytophagaceae bacterium]|jgi:hypothetical protein|nr:gliding motility-associated C-terminal domain-containing protein [Cytophagaceae bacterium]
MKRLCIIFIGLFLSIISLETYAQTVTVCIKIRGVANAANKIAYLCKNDTISLSVTNCAVVPETHISYQWKNLSKPPSLDSIANSHVIAKDTGVWVGYIKDSINHVVYSDTVHLLYNPTTSLGSMSPNSINLCPNVPQTISLVSTVGTFNSYQWYNKTSGPLIPITGATSSTYSLVLNNANPDMVLFLIAKDSYGCSDSLISGYYSEKSFAPVNLGNDTSVCIGTNLTVSNHPNNLAPFGTTNYTYSRDLPLITPCSHSSVAYVVGGTYIPCTIPLPTAGKIKIWMTISPTGACVTSDTMVVTVFPIPTVNLGPTDTLMCYNAGMTINSKLVGTAPFNLTWSSSPAGFSSSASSVTVNPTVSTTYTLMVTDSNNCGVGQNNILVNVNPQINVGISKDTTICFSPAGTAKLKATVNGGVSPYNFSWTPVTALSSLFADSTFASPTATTTYTFTANDNSNCSVSKSVVVTSYSPAIAAMVSPVTISEVKTATLSALLPSNSTFNFSWKTDKGALPAVGATPGPPSSLYLEYEGPDTVNYVVIVKDPSNNCVNSDTVQVWSISDNTLLYVPNVFSPHAENPVNQKFTIYGDNLLPDNFKIVVYNKWGNLVYESTDLNDTKTNGWDGGPKIEGVYTYVIAGQFKNGKDVQVSPYYKGSFSLIR